MLHLRRRLGGDDSTVECVRPRPAPHHNTRLIRRPAKRHGPFTRRRFLAGHPISLYYGDDPRFVNLAVRGFYFFWLVSRGGRVTARIYGAGRPPPFFRAALWSHRRPCARPRARFGLKKRRGAFARPTCHKSAPPFSSLHFYESVFASARRARPRTKSVVGKR